MNLAPLDRGVRLVEHNVNRVKYDEDPALPFRIEVVMHHGEFMIVAAVCLYGGTEQIVAQAETLAWAEDFVKRNDLEGYSRWLRTTIKENGKVVVERTPASKEADAAAAATVVLTPTASKSTEPRKTPKGWRASHDGPFWIKETAKGNRYRCKTCDHDTLGYSPDARDMHYRDCPYLRGKKMP
jgi:hypothetical protein